MCYFKSRCFFSIFLVAFVSLFLLFYRSKITFVFDISSRLFTSLSTVKVSLIDQTSVIFHCTCRTPKCFQVIDMFKHFTKIGSFIEIWHSFSLKTEKSFALFLREKRKEKKDYPSFCSIALTRLSPRPLVSSLTLEREQ